MASKKIKICGEQGCDNAVTTRKYCRLHYLKNWKIIKSEEKKKAAEKLNRYVEGICKQNPDKYISEVKRDLREGKEPDGSLDEDYPEQSNLNNVFSEIKEESVSLDTILNKIHVYDKY